MKQDNTRPRKAEDIVVRYRTLLKEAETLQSDLDSVKGRIAEINAILSTLHMDSELSATSPNPVMNRTITRAINTLAESIPKVIDSFKSESKTDALSAAKGKELNDRLTALEGGDNVID